MSSSLTTGLWRVAVLLILLRIWWGLDPRMPIWAWTGAAIGGVILLAVALFRSYRPEIEQRRDRAAHRPDELGPSLRYESARRGQL